MVIQMNCLPNAKSYLFSYESLPIINWDKFQYIKLIKEHLEKYVPFNKSGEQLKIYCCLLNF